MTQSWSRCCEVKASSGPTRPSRSPSLWQERQPTFGRSASPFFSGASASTSVASCGPTICARGSHSGRCCCAERNCASGARLIRAPCCDFRKTDERHHLLRRQLLPRHGRGGVRGARVLDLALDVRDAPLAADVGQLGADRAVAEAPDRVAGVAGALEEEPASLRGRAARAASRPRRGTARSWPGWPPSAASATASPRRPRGPPSPRPRGPGRRGRSCSRRSRTCGRGSSGACAAAGRPSRSGGRRCRCGRSCSGRRARARSCARSSARSAGRRAARAARAAGLSAIFSACSK